MGWAAKFGTGFFQGAAQSFPGAYAQTQEQKRQDRQAQLSTYLSLLNEVQTPEEAQELIKGWESSDPTFQSFDEGAKGRVRAAASGIGALVGSRIKRETGALAADTSSAIESLSTFDSEDPKAFTAQKERAVSQRQALTKALTLNPALAQDPMYQDQLEKLQTIEEQLGEREKGARGRELTRGLNLETAQSLARTPGATPDSIRAAVMAAGGSESDAQNIIQSNLSLTAARAEERKYQQQVDERNFAQQQYLQQQEERRQQQRLSDGILLDPQSPPALREAAYKTASALGKELYLQGGIMASGVAEVDAISNTDPVGQYEAWNLLPPEVKATANPLFENQLLRRIEAQEGKSQYMNVKDAEGESFKLGLRAIMDAEVQQATLEERPIDATTLAQKQREFINSFYAQKKEPRILSWSEVADSYKLAFAQNGGTAQAAEQVYEMLMKSSASPEDKRSVLGRLSEHNAAFTPLLMRFNQEAVQPTQSQGLTAGQGAVLLGGAAVGVGAGKMLANKAGVGSQPYHFRGTGERGVVAPPVSGFNPEAPPPVFRGPGGQGPGAPALPIPEELPPGATPPPSPRTPTLGAGRVAGESPENLMPFGEGGAGPGKLEESLQRAHKAGAISAAEVDQIRKSGNTQELTEKLKEFLNKKMGKKLMDKAKGNLGKAGTIGSAVLAIPVLLDLAEQSKERNITAQELFNSLFGPNAAE